MNVKRNPSGGSLQEKATVTKFSDNIRRLTPLELQCQLFCGGRRCKYEGSSTWTNQQMALNGFYSHWITNKIVAMARPNSEQIEKYNLISQFQSQGIQTIINLQQPGEHCYCGPPLNDSGFSYSPTVFMENGIYFYNYGWKDYSVASLSSITDTVKVIVFSLQQGKVAIHCHAGLGRTGVLVACYLVFAYRISANAAIRFVRWKRPNSIQTRAQVMCVFQFAEYILPKFTVFAQKDSTNPRFTLSEHQRCQSVILHGYESRNLRYLPKIIHEICDRLLHLCRCEPVASLDNLNDDPYPQSFWAYFLCMQKDSKLLSNLASPTSTLGSGTSSSFEINSSPAPGNESISEGTGNNTVVSNTSPDDSEEFEQKGLLSKTKDRNVDQATASNVEIVLKNSEFDEADFPKLTSSGPRKSSSDDCVTLRKESSKNGKESTEKVLRPLRTRPYKDIGDKIVFPARVVSCSSVLLFPEGSPPITDSESMPREIENSLGIGSDPSQGETCCQSFAECTRHSRSSTDINANCFTEDLLSEKDFETSATVPPHLYCTPPLRKAGSEITTSKFPIEISSRTVACLKKSQSCIEVATCQKLSQLLSDNVMTQQGSNESSDDSEFLVRRISAQLDLRTTGVNVVKPPTRENIMEGPSSESLTPMVLQDEYVDLSVLEKLFNKSTSQQSNNGSSPTSSSITAEQIADWLIKDLSELPENATKTMENIKEKINTTHDGWDALRSTSNLPALSGLLFSWLKHLKQPLITKDQLIRMSVSFEDPITQLHTLDRTARVTVEYLARFVINLQPLSECRKHEIFSKLFHYFCHFIPDGNPDDGKETEADYPITNIVQKFAHNLLDLYLKEI